jgi:hypothetical protein
MDDTNITPFCETDFFDLFDEALNAHPHLLIDIGFNRQVDWMIQIWDSTGVGIKAAPRVFCCQHRNRHVPLRKAAAWLSALLRGPEQKTVTRTNHGSPLGS